MADEQGQGTTQPDTIARSIRSVLQRTRSALSPWVQRQLEDTSGGDAPGASVPRRRLGGMAVAEPRTVVRLEAPSLVMRVQRTTEADTSGAAPLVDRFSTGVVQRHRAVIGGETRFRQDTLQPQIPAPSTLPLPGVSGGLAQRSAAPGEMSLEQLAALHAAEASAASETAAGAADVQRTPEGSGGFTTEPFGPTPTMADIQDAIRRAAQSGPRPGGQSPADIQRSTAPESAGTLAEIEARVREARARQTSTTGSGTVQRAPDASGGLLAEIERRVQEARARASGRESGGEGAGALPLSTVPRGGVQRVPEEGSVMAEIERRIQAARAGQAPPSTPSADAPDVQTERAAPAMPPSASPSATPPTPPLPPPSPPAESVQRVPQPGDPDYSAAAELHRRLTEMRARRSQMTSRAASTSSTALPGGESVQRTPEAEPPSAPLPSTETPPARPSVENIEERVQRMREQQRRAAPPTVQRSTQAPLPPRPPGAPADRHAMWMAPPRSERAKEPQPDPVEAARLRADMTRVQRMRDEKVRAQAELDAARAARGEVVQREPQPGDPGYSVTSALSERASASRDRHEKRLRGELPPLVRNYSSDPESPDYSKVAAIQERLQRAAELRAAAARGDVIPAPRISTDPESPRYSRAAAISERIRQAREQALQRAAEPRPAEESPASPPAPEASPPTEDVPPPVVHRTVSRESNVTTISPETGQAEVRRMRAFSRSVVLTPERKHGFGDAGSQAASPATPATPEAPAAPSQSGETVQRSPEPPAPPSPAERSQASTTPPEAPPAGSQAPVPPQPPTTASPPAPSSAPSSAPPSESVQRRPQPGDHDFSVAAEIQRRLAEARERRAGSGRQANDAPSAAAAPPGPSPTPAPPSAPNSESVQRAPQPGDADYSRAAEIQRRLAAARERRAAQARSTGAEGVQRTADSTGDSSESSGTSASTDDEESSRVQRSAETGAPAPPPEQAASTLPNRPDIPSRLDAAPVERAATEPVQRSATEPEPRDGHGAPSPPSATVEPVSDRTEPPGVQRLAGEDAAPVESTPQEPVSPESRGAEPGGREPGSSGPTLAETVARSVEPADAAPNVQRQEETGAASEGSTAAVERQPASPESAPASPVADSLPPAQGPVVQRDASSSTAEAGSQTRSTAPEQPVQRRAYVDSAPDSAEVSPPSAETKAPDTVQRAADTPPEVRAAPESDASQQMAAVQRAPDVSQETADGPPDRDAGAPAEPTISRSPETTHDAVRADSAPTVPVQRAADTPSTPVAEPALPPTVSDEGTRASSDATPDRLPDVDSPDAPVSGPSVQRASESAPEAAPIPPAAPDGPVVQRMPETPADVARPQEPAAPSPTTPSQADAGAAGVQRATDERVAPPQERPGVQRSPDAGSAARPHADTPAPPHEASSGATTGQTIERADEPVVDVQREADVVEPAPPQPVRRAPAPSAPVRDVDRPAPRPAAPAPVQRTPQPPARTTPKTPAPRARSRPPSSRPSPLAPTAPSVTKTGKPAFLQRRPQDEPKIEWAKPDEIDADTLRRLADLDAGFFSTGPSSAAAKPEELAGWSPITRRQGDPRLLARMAAEGIGRTKTGSSLSSISSTLLGERRSAQRDAKKGQPLPLPALRLTSTGQRLQRVGEDEGEKTTEEEEQIEGWVPTGPMPGARRDLQIGSHRSGESDPGTGPSQSPGLPKTLITPRSRGDDDELSMGGTSDLDALARQILPIVKRLMSIERERRAVR